MKKLFYVAFLFLLSITVLAEILKDSSPGKEIFGSKCAKCHGNDGKKGKWGAKNLQQSKLTDTELIYIISNGKRAMPSWKYKLKEEEIKIVKDYIKTLRR